MTDISDITVTVEIEQVWTWPSLGRVLMVVRSEAPAFGETTSLVGYDL